jgi:hypothetical protein
MTISILDPERRYSFSDYFDLNAPVERILAEFGYAYQQEFLELPFFTHPDPQVTDALAQTYRDVLPYTRLTSETAKREILISPFLIEVVRATHARLNIEYALSVERRLNGSLDYLLQSERELIVIEAKKGDLDRGFVQLAVELVALDVAQSAHPTTHFYGAVTIGELWRFGRLDRDDKRITQDLHGYRLPEDVATLFGVVLGVLRSDAQSPPG